MCRSLGFLNLNPVLCHRNCCVNQYFAPLFFVVFVLMAQFVLVRNNIKRKIRKERIMTLNTPINKSNNTGKRRGCRSYETSWRVAQTGGTRQRVKSSWLSFLVSDVQFCMVCMFPPPGPLETDPIESELSGFPGQVWGSLPRAMLQTVRAGHQRADGQGARKGHDEEAAENKGGVDAQDRNLLWLDRRWSVRRQ